MAIAAMPRNVRKAVSGFIVAIALGACAPVGLSVGQTSGAGDYSLLNCAQLGNASEAIRQRLAGLESPSAALGAATPQGARLAEQKSLLISAAEDVLKSRRRLGCLAPAQTIAASAPLEEEPVAAAPERVAAAPKPAVSAPQRVAAAPAASSASGARYLQVGMFADARNSERVVAHFRSRGLSAASMRSTEGGAVRNRVIVGPLQGRASIAAADRAARAIGVNDAFFVKN